VLQSFLNDMMDLESRRSEEAVVNGQSDPDAWGELVMARAQTGEVLDLDPELYWEGIYNWFRSRGVDPHAIYNR
jgi:hypothetical protein